MTVLATLGFALMKQLVICIYAWEVYMLAHTASSHITDAMPHVLADILCPLQFWTACGADTFLQPDNHGSKLANASGVFRAAHFIMSIMYSAALLDRCRACLNPTYKSCSFTAKEKIPCICIDKVPMATLHVLKATLPACQGLANPGHISFLFVVIYAILSV